MSTRVSAQRLPGIGIKHRVSGGQGGPDTESGGRPVERERRGQTRGESAPRRRCCKWGNHIEDRTSALQLDNMRVRHGSATLEVRGGAVAAECASELRSARAGLVASQN